MSRTILHCDMNNFYASVECIKNPSLSLVPLAVCGSVEERHGIVLAKNEIAKKYGISTGEPVVKAQAKCPSLTIVSPHYDEYVKYSRLARQIYCDYTDMVEPFGDDECWLDVTGSTLLFGDGETVANTIRNRIKKELGLTVSVGVSFNKVFAKLGSDMKKPDAVTVIKQEEFKEKIWDLPASAMIGIGRSTSQALSAYGIHTIGQLASAYPPLIKHKLGKNGLWLIEAANGRNSEPVMRSDADIPVKSIGHGTTTRCDMKTLSEVKTVMLELCEDIGHRLILCKKKARGVSISLRDNTLFTKQYQKRLTSATDSYSHIAEQAFLLMNERHVFSKPLRSVSVTAIDLVPSSFPCQIDLFSDSEGIAKREKIDKLMDDINNKYGAGKIRYGVLFS